MFKGIICVWNHDHCSNKVSVSSSLMRRYCIHIFWKKAPTNTCKKNLTTPKAQTNKTNPTKFMSPISICTWRIYYTGVSKELLRTCIFLKEHGRKKFLINFRIKLCKNIILSLHIFFQIVLKNRKAWEISRQLKGTLLCHS